MPTLPALDIKAKINHSPHIVILGAGKYPELVNEIEGCIQALSSVSIQISSAKDVKRRKRGALVVSKPLFFGPTNRL